MKRRNERRWKQRINKRVSCRTLRIGIARINQLTGRSRMNIISRDVHKTRTRSHHGPSPCRRNQRRTSRDPVVAPGADTTSNPLHARFQHDLIDRGTTNSEEHVVVHLETLDTVEDLHARARLTLAQDEGVVDEAITAVSRSEERRGG